MPRIGYQASLAIAYGERDRQYLDVYTPMEVSAPTPVVVFFYGGRWSVGARAEYRFIGQVLASHGIAAVIPDYRLYPEVRFSAFVEDGAMAVHWTHERKPPLLLMAGASDEKVRPANPINLANRMRTAGGRAQ